MTLIDPGPAPAASGEGQHDSNPADDDAGGLTSEAGTRAAVTRVGGWVRVAPAERAPLLAIPGIWTTAELLHIAGVSPLACGAITAAAAGFAGWLGERRQHDGQGEGGPETRPGPEQHDEGNDEPGQDEDDSPGQGDADASGGELPEAYRRPAHPRLRGAELAAATAGVGIWASLAAKWGAAGGPDHLVGLLYLTGAAGGYWWLRTHEAVRAARARRDAAGRAEQEALAREELERAKRADWRNLAGEVGLGGALLMRWKATRNGEEWEIDTHGARKLASHIDTRTLSQQLAGQRRRTKQMVEVRPDPDYPYRIHVLWRARDPWAGGGVDGIIWHPWKSGRYDPVLPYADLVPEHRSIRQPVVFGVDPETGTPLQIPLWDSQGAKRIALIGMSESGKSTVLDTLREWITAAPDARLIQVNLGKALEDSWWAGLAEANALSGDPDATARAMAILDWCTRGIALRRHSPQRAAGAREHEPTPEEPLFCLLVDELDAVVKAGGKDLLDMIASKARSEGWALIVSSQRAVQGWLPVSVRANLSHLIFGKMRPSDLRALAGSDGLWLPDMNSYGRGNAGIWGVCQHPTFEGMPFLRGRSFFWGKPATGLVSLAKARAQVQQPYELEPVLASLAEQWAAITGAVPMAELAKTDARYDLTTTASGQSVPGTARTREQLAKARADLERIIPAPGAAAGDAPPPPAAPDSTAAQASPAGQRGRWANEWRTPIRPGHQEQLREMLCRPGGISSRRAAAAVPYSHETIARQFRWWAGEGLTHKRGSGPFERWEAVEGRPWKPLTHPDLQVVPGQAGQDDPGAQTAVSGSEAREPDQVIPPGEMTFTRSEVALMAAGWGLAYGSPEQGVDLGAAAAHARKCGLPEDVVDEVVALLRSHPQYVAGEAIRSARQAGAPVPPWLARWAPGADDEPGQDDDGEDDEGLEPGDLGEDPESPGPGGDQDDDYEGEAEGA